MTADYEEKCSCWEWFNVKSETHAKKLQETGDVEIKLGAIGEHWEVEYTGFLTDISFRIDRKKSEIPASELPKWRLNIRQGSYIKWPVLVNEEVVSMAEPQAADGQGKRWGSDQVN